MNYLIEIAAYVCECVTLLLCIHSFLGKKIKLDYKTVLLVIMLVTILMTILHLNLSGICTMVNQSIIFVYIHFEFKINWRQNLILMILVLLINVAIQAITTVPAYFILAQKAEANVIGLSINITALIIMIIFTRWKKLNRIYILLIKWDKKIIESLLICSILFVYLIVKYKLDRNITILPYFISAIMAILVIIILLNWQKDRYKIKQKELELRVHDLYGKAFESMIENIRIRQHDFKNQLAAIYGMHLTATSFEDLVERQREHCNHLESDSRYDSILTKCNDKVLAGFLYTKLSEAEKIGVEVKFDIAIGDLHYKLEIYEIIEVVGILIDNAVEYESEKAKKIYVQLKEQNDKLYILCRNITEYIPQDTIYKFFRKGFSTKGEDRGLGLHNLKKLLEGKGEIVVSNQLIEDDNWLVFKIEIDKKG